MSTPLLVAKDLSKTLWDGDQSHIVFQEINLRLHAAERVALVGPSGSGKSSLLNILGGLDQNFSGEVLIENRSLKDMSDAELSRFRNTSLGFVFQSYNLLGQFTALENVLLPGMLGTEIERGLGEETLRAVGLGDKMLRRPVALSGGERQRVAIARALVQKPKIVLCDEPTGNLDQKTGLEILKLFDRLTESGAAVIIATHDPHIAATASKRWLLDSGKLVEAM